MMNFFFKYFIICSWLRETVIFLRNYLLIGLVAALSVETTCRCCKVIFTFQYIIYCILSYVNINTVLLEVVIFLMYWYK